MPRKTTQKEKKKTLAYAKIRKEKARLIKESKGSNKDEGFFEHRCPDCGKGLYRDITTIRLGGGTLADLGGLCKKCHYYHCVDHRIIYEEETDEKYADSYYLCHTCAKLMRSD
jgi:hypothetical protein